MIVIAIILLLYIGLILDAIRILKTKKDVEAVVTAQRCFLFGASSLKSLDEDDVKFGTFQIAFGFLVLTITYTV